MGEIIGAVISLLSLGTGYGLGRIRRSKSLPKPPKLKCSCDHGLSFHDKDTGHCHGLNENNRYEDGVFSYSEQEPCTCRQYDGPVPYDTYVARELT